MLPVLAVMLVSAFCDQKKPAEVQGAYRTRDGLASLEFQSDRRYLFRHRMLDISIHGEYHMADARKIFLHLPLRRADENLGPPMLLRYRDELRLHKTDGEIVKFYRQRDPHDGPDPLAGELPEVNIPRDADEAGDEDKDAADSNDETEDVPIYGEAVEQ